ncbi:MAG: nitrous oxide-stimulated promoter family protein [Prevotella sp.]|jgi:hypothetical protein
MKNSQSKLQRDQQTIRLMIDIYCRHHLGASKVPQEYQELADYACRRLEHCRWGEQKPACKDCPTHCYAPEKRKRIQEIMRWTGPRMLFYSPRAVMRHLCQCMFNKSNNQKEK